MSHHQIKISCNFGAGFTPLIQKMLIFYTVIYIAELLLEHWFRIPFVSYLQLWPASDDMFHFRQIFTSPFIHDPRSPLLFLINCLLLYFFAGTVERAIGTRRFLFLFYTAAMGGILCGMAMSGVSGFENPFSGMMPSLLAVIVVFGLLNPDAMILVMFVIPVKARYLSYGTVIITLLTFLAKTNPLGAYDLGGIFFGYLCFRGPWNVLNPNALSMRYHDWQFERKKRSRFQVIEGFGKTNNRDKPPTYH